MEIHLSLERLHRRHNHYGSPLIQRKSDQKKIHLHRAHYGWRRAIIGLK
jgi:hypothetical protein